MWHHVYNVTHQLDLAMSLQKRVQDKLGLGEESILLSNLKLLIGLFVFVLFFT